MIDNLNNIFKKYVAIFLDEYKDFLSRDQLEILKSINYEKTIIIDKTEKPFGKILLGQIHLSSDSEKMIDNMRNMPEYNSNHTLLHNKNMSMYLKYICDNGYNLEDYYSDILMYFVFDLVIKNQSGLIKGLINQEIKYLSIKYSLRIPSLYAREEAIINKITPIIGIEGCRKVLFSDSATSFKYLNDKKGFKIAKLVNDVEELIEEEYTKLSSKTYAGYEGFLDYIDDYDHLSYGDVYNYLLDYEVENSL